MNDGCLAAAGGSTKKNEFVLHGSDDIHQLLFYFLQLIFHLHHDLLYAGIIRFGPDSIYFTSNLLGDESKLLAVGHRLIHRTDEIITMAFQPRLLFADIVTLYI